MKCTIVLTDGEEKIVIYTKKECPLTDKILALAKSDEEAREIIGYREGEVKRLDPAEIQYVATEGGKVSAAVGNRKYRIKERLYTLEAVLGKDFIKINQSCLANIRHIDRFAATVGGALSVIFKNGERDFVSRRQLSAVKAAYGIK